MCACTQAETSASSVSYEEEDIYMYLPPHMTQAGTSRVHIYPFLHMTHMYPPPHMTQAETSASRVNICACMHVLVFPCVTCVFVFLYARTHAHTHKQIGRAHMYK
jgi:hypothetical protein